MAEWKLFEGDASEFATPEWYADRDAAPHLEQEGHRDRLLLTASMVKKTVDGGSESVCDLGAGDGGLLQAVRALGVTVPMWGYDLQPKNVEAAAARGVSVELADFIKEPVLFGETVVLAEVLEHLTEPHKVLKTLTGFSPVKWLVCSSPYTETADSHYEHHLWAFDLDGYRQMIEKAGWNILAQETAWICQVILAVRE